MSVPALRQPKSESTSKKNIRKIQNDHQFIILTLKNSMKLVITSDSFHCIRNVEYKYVCALCNIKMETSQIDVKEAHKALPEHQKLLKMYPYLEELAEHLIRQIDNFNCYCTMCNIVMPVQSVLRHVSSDEHTHELNKALLRVNSYKPIENFCIYSMVKDNKK